MPLEQIADLSGGFAFKSEDYAASGRFVLRSLNIRSDGSIDRRDAVFLPEDKAEQYPRFLLKPHDTLFVMVGASLGKIGFVRERDLPALLNQNMWRIRAKPAADSRFLHYAFRVAARSGLGWASGSARDFVRRNDYRLLPLSCPTLSEQRAVAAILGALDDKIELNRRMSATLEAMARALFKSWFVDFDPVRAKAEGRDPGLLPEIAALFPDSFEDSELGEVPKGWASSRVADLADVFGGGTPSTSDPAYWDGPFSWVTPKDLSGLSFPVLLSTQRTITSAGLAKISSGLLPAGTLLLSSRAPIGYLAITEIPVAINQGFIAIRPRPGVSNLFLLRWAEWAHDEIVSHANGSTFLEISKSNFRPIPITKPSEAVMMLFEKSVRPLHDRVVLAERESRVLAALRDTLLPKLISGEIGVSAAKRPVEQAV